MSHLRDLQLRFQDYLIDDSAAIEADIVSTENALAKHRLGAYYNAYRIRLIDALAVDFSALDSYLGRDTFEQLALDYLHEYPSQHPSVRWFGRHFPAFLEDRYVADDAELVRELAGYEWTQTTLFDAADSPRLVQLDDMTHYPPETWPELRFEFKHTLSCLDLHWNVTRIKAAADSGEAIPAARREDIPQRWLLWRRDFKIHWRSLDVHEAWAFEQAAAGANFATICEGLMEWVDAEHVALVAAGFLRQWISDQLLLALTTPGDD